MGSCLITFQSSALTWPPAPRSTTLRSHRLGGRRVMDFGEVIGFGVPPRPGFWIGPRTTGEGFRETHIAFVAPDRAAVRAFFQAVSALMPECSMNHACGPSTSQAITAPSCMTPTATTSKPFAAPPDSDRRRACRHLPLLTTVRLLQARVEPERGWLLQRR
jgi:hypothetical protein